MKRQFLLLAALGLAAAQAWGQTVIASGTCGAEGDGSNVTWTLTADSTLTISGTGAMADYVNQNYQPWYEYQGSIKACTIADGVTSVGRSAFWLCPALESVAIGADVAGIGTYAFTSCPALTSVTLPDGVTSIEAGAFSNCTALTSVILPDGVTSIEGSIFSGCTSLTSVILPDGVTSIEGYAFEGCTSLASVILPDGVTSIGYSAFKGCTSLASAILPDGVTSIGDYAFDGCTALASVILPDGVTSIGSYAFYDCTSLASLTIGNGVTSIGGYAFWNCTALTNLTCRAAVPPAIEYGTFNKVDKTIPVYVPAGSIEAYRTAEYWDEFTNYLPIGSTTGIAAPSLGESIMVKDGEVCINIIGINEVRVYDLQGRHVLSTTESRFTLPQGVYIIKVGDEAISLIP